jgi:hypothetical protein
MEKNRILDEALYQIDPPTSEILYILNGRKETVFKIRYRKKVNVSTSETYTFLLIYRIFGENLNGTEKQNNESRSFEVINRYLPIVGSII